MKLHVRVKPKAKETRVVHVDETHFSVWVKEPPEEGRANEAVLRAVCEYLGVGRARVSLVRGGRSKNKVIEFDG